MSLSPRDAMRPTLIGTIISLLPFLIAGCSADQRELSRQASPDTRLVAVLMEALGRGSQGTVEERIYVNDQGIPLSLDRPVFTAVGCEHVRFKWVNEYTLEIHYETTCAISQFTNRWDRPSNVAAGKPNPIEIVLVRG